MLNVSTMASPLTPMLRGASVSEEGVLLGVAWDVDPERAVDRALGEARERRWARFMPENETFAVRSVAQVDEQFGFIRNYQYASLAGLPYSGFWPYLERREAVFVVPASDGTLVPATLIWPGVRLGPNLPPILESSSAGLATGSTPQNARDHARWELHERDVIMRLHLGKVSPSPSLVPSDLTELVDAVSRLGIAVHVALADPFVAVAAVVAHDNGLPKASLASSAHSLQPAALRGAILEAFQVFHFALQSLRRGVALRDLPTNAAERSIWWAMNGGLHWRRYIFPTRDYHEVNPGRSHSDIRIFESDTEGSMVVKALAPGWLHLSPSDKYPLHVSGGVHPLTVSQLSQAHPPHPFV